MSPWIGIAALAVAGLVAAVATPLVMRAARVIGAVDKPNERKVSRRDGMPLLGGLAVACGFFVAVSMIVLFAERGELASHVEAYILGGIILLGIGVWDDRFSLNAFEKIGPQVVAALIAIALDFRIDHLTDPFSRAIWAFPDWLTWIVTLVWIVGVTNAFNLIDGLDGLATGVGAIICATLALIAFQANQMTAVLVGLALFGALLGFLPFNFSPARIFLGDTGSLFIGYTLALLSLESYAKATVLTFLVPLLVLAVPIIDTGMSIARRVRQKRPIFSADRLHMHHRLLESEGTHRRAVLSLYFLTACFCIIAISFTRLEGWAALVFLGLVVLLTLRLLRNLGFFELPDKPASAAPGEEADTPAHPAKPR